MSINIQKLGIDELLQKEMDRKDFLKHVGVAMVAMTGVSALVRSLTQHPLAGQQNQVSQMQGYGSMPYGGSKSVR